MEEEVNNVPAQNVFKVNQAKAPVVKRTQGPSKLLDLQKQVKEKKPEDMPPPQKKEESDYDDSFENYEEDEFEPDDDKKDIKKALKHENRRANKFQAKNVFNNFSAKKASNTPFLALSQNGLNASRASSGGSDRPNKVTGSEGGFAQNRGIVMAKKKINSEVANKQYERTDALKEIIEIDYEEFDNQLNIKPQTKQDLYFNRLQTFQIHNEMVQSNDNYISKDIQTEEIEENSVAVQFPEDFSKSDETHAKGSHDLAGFIRRVTPVIEMVLEENVVLADLANPKAKDKNPVEKKASITCPPDLLKVLS